MDYFCREGEEANFIKNVSKDGDKLLITYSDDRVETEEYTLHNINFYRRKMINQVLNEYQDLEDEMVKESFKSFVMRYGSGILTLALLYLDYNIDIHVVMKIILAIIILLGEVFAFLVNTGNLLIQQDRLDRVEALYYYAKNSDSFEYSSKKYGDFNYVLSIEKIDEYELSVDDLEKYLEEVKNWKELGKDLDDLELKLEKKSISK